MEDLWAEKNTCIHNAVSLDMLLEQTFNADAKEDGGLSGITMNAAARGCTQSQ